MSMPQIMDIFLGAVFSLEALPLVAVLGFMLGAKSAAARGWALLLLGAVPIMLMLVLLTTSGCWWDRQCMGMFGMMLAFGAGVYWLVSALLGMALRSIVTWLLARRRARDGTG